MPLLLCKEWNMPDHPHLRPLRTLLRGLGQIMLQENAGTGFLFLLGICLGSVWMGLAALLAAGVGSLCALLWAWGRQELEQGLYGFSPALVGVAFILYFKNTPLLWLVLIGGAALAAFLQHVFIRFKIQVFTLPFVLVTWLALGLAGKFFPEFLNAPAPPRGNETWAFAIRGFGEVIFQEGIGSGLLFLAGVLLHSPRAALLSLAGAVYAAFLASALSVPHASLATGLFSYNAVLCTLVFSGRNRREMGWAAIAITLSVGLQWSMVVLAWPVLTFPFVGATMAGIGLRKQVSRFFRA